MKNWFTSDTHFGHENILKYSNRPFNTIEDMDKTLIRNWNARVQPEDTIFFLGDFCFNISSSFKNYWYALNGTKIMIKGNHDHHNGVNTPILDMTIKLGGETMLLIHRPSDVGVFDGKLVLCGHVHNAWKFDRRYIEKDFHIDFVNVGVDVWGFRPININEIMDEYRKWKKTLLPA